MDIVKHTTTTVQGFNLTPHLPFNANDLDGWNVDYIIAGGYVHDIVNGLVPNDIDMWIMTERGYHSLLEYFSNIFTNVKYHIHAIFIEIEADDLQYNIQLINVIGSTPIEIIGNFDMDYIRCYYDGINVNTMPDCLESWDTKVVRNMNMFLIIRPSRLLKAHLKGYQFERKLAKSINMPVDDCCTINNRRVYRNDFIFCETHTEYWKEPMYIDPSLLDGYNQTLSNRIDRQTVPVKTYKLITLETYEHCCLILPIVISHPLHIKGTNMNYTVLYEIDLETINNLINSNQINDQVVYQRYVQDDNTNQYNY
jgi:hypothetical protein